MGNLFEDFDRGATSKQKENPFLIDVAKFLEQNKHSNYDPDPTRFSKSELAKVAGFEWLNDITATLLSPDSRDINAQKVLLHNFKEELKSKAVFLDSSFSTVFPEGFKERVISLDTETSGLDTRVIYDRRTGDLISKVDMAGFSVAISSNEGWYLPVNHLGERDGIFNWDKKVIMQFLGELHQEFFIIYHNAVFDRDVVSLNGMKGLRPFPYFSDTLILDTLFDCNRGGQKHSLKICSDLLLGRKMMEIHELFAIQGILKKKKDTYINFNQIPCTTGYVYAVADAINTFGLFEFYSKQEGVLNPYKGQATPLSIDLQMIDTLRKITRQAFPIDWDYAYVSSLEAIYRHRLLEQEIYRVAGYTFGIGSPQQVSVLLFEEFNIPTLPEMKRGAPKPKYPKGLYSTAADLLVKLQEEHPDYTILNMIILFRQMHNITAKLFSKMLLNTWTDGLRPYMGVKIEYTQSVIPTGRISSASQKSKETVAVKQNKPGNFSYKHSKGAWTAGFNTQGVNNMDWVLVEANCIEEIPEEAGLNLENPYSEKDRLQLIEMCAGVV